MADNVVGIDIVARLDSFRAELAKIPDIGADEAKNLTAQLSKEIKAAERAATSAATASKNLAKANKELGKNTEDATAANKEFAQNAQKTSGEAMKLGAAINFLVPGGGAAAQALGQLSAAAEVAATAGEALELSMGAITAITLPLAGIIAGVAWAWGEHTKAAEDDAKAVDLSKEAYDKLVTALRDARIEHDRLTGHVSDADAKIQNAANTLKDQYGPALDAAKKKLEEARKAEAAQADILAKSVDQSEADKQLLEQLTAATGEAADAYSKLKTEYKATHRVQAENIVLTDQQTKGKKDEAAATKNAGEAARKAAEALKEQNDQLAAADTAAAAARKSYDDVIAKLGELADADRTAAQSAAGRLEAEHEAALQQIADLKRQAEAVATTATAQENVEAETLAAMKAENVKYAADVQKLHDSLYAGLVQKAQQAANQQAAAQAAAWDSVRGEADAAASSIIDYFGEESAAGKAAAAAQLILGEIELLANAAKLGPAAPLYIAAGEVPLALGAAKLAGFNDTPGPITVPEVGASYHFAPRDIVVAGRTPEAVQRQVNQLGGGSSSAAGPTVIKLQVNGRTSQQVVAQAERGRRGTGRRHPVGQKRRKG